MPPARGPEEPGRPRAEDPHYFRNAGSAGASGSGSRHFDKIGQPPCPSLRRQARTLRNPRADWRRRHGRSIQSARHSAWPLGCIKGSQDRIQPEVRAESTRRRCAQPLTDLHALRCRTELAGENRHCPSRAMPLILLSNRRFRYTGQIACLPRFTSLFASGPPWPLLPPRCFFLRAN